MSRNTTLHQRKLFNALLARGVPAEMEEGDGHKHVDIGIPSARIYIEVDGLHHLTSAEQILRDITRDHYSNDEGKATIHVPNEFLDTHLDAIADAIAMVVQERRWTLATSSRLDTRDAL
jgi:very-short-patch-repair endonuclease